ncbi:MAG TPA: SMP-30/gluconolactonase/LRE family protein [Gemmatimonadaceae bacterium]|nr:SMP-30/gluconolactonase/LRE family protein [Gemmatimonadaceae bacterium]
MKQLGRALLLTLMTAACTAAPSSDIASHSDARRLSTGAYLDPAGRSTDVGGLPLAMLPSPDGRQLVLLLNGFREQGIQVVDRASGEITQTLLQRAAFLGLVFSHDGKSLYASGGDDDIVYHYRWADGRGAIADTIVIAPMTQGHRHGMRYPGGIALSADDKTLYVAENLGDSLAVVDLASGKVTQRLETQRYPYGVVVGNDGTVFVSAWGGSTVSVFTPSGGVLTSAGRIPAGRHPSAMLLSHDGSRLFVTSGSTDKVIVIDTHERKAIAQLDDAPPAGPGEGSTPNALALSPDGSRLFVAEADDNAIAVFNMSARTSGVPTALGDDKLSGRIPTGWYPTAVWATRDSLFIVNGKGRGAGPNPRGPQPISKWTVDPRSTTRGQLSGTLMMTDVAAASGSALAQLTGRVSRANGWDRIRKSADYPPIEHVIYIIKENRTYDQVLGDLSQADGDTSLLFFPRPVSPNHHALAERFGIYDRFFVNAEVSPDGHNWSTAAYTTDYVQKTVPSNYSNRGRSYDYEGMNRETAVDDDVAEPSSGYLWNLAQKAGLTYRDYGEFVIDPSFRPDGTQSAGYTPDKQALKGHTNEAYAGFGLNVTDQSRADVWVSEMEKFDHEGTMPALEIVRLPNDHTGGARADWPTPRAYMADNDLALGRMIESLSKTRFWKNSAVFVVEDDAQNGPDHVDSHRSVMYVISPYAAGGVIHRWVNTTDVIATIEEILKLGTMSQFDHYGRPLHDIWKASPDLRPYVALKPAVPLDEKNPKVGVGAEQSRKLALGKEDEANEDLFNRVLWRAIKGESRKYPGPTRMSALELKR